MLNTELGTRKTEYASTSTLPNDSKSIIYTLYTNFLRQKYRQLDIQTFRQTVQMFEIEMLAVSSVLTV